MFYLAFALAPQTRAGCAAMAKLDAEKLTPLLRLRYGNAIADAVADLGSADQIRRVFVGFQKYLYEARSN